jgi:hypothetical protein
MAAFIGGGKEYSQGVEGGLDADGGSAEPGDIGVVGRASEAGLGGAAEGGGADDGTGLAGAGRADDADPRARTRKGVWPGATAAASWAG